MTAASPFQIAVPEAVLVDLRQRLAITRWPDAVEHAAWDYGTDLDYLKELVGYWQQHFDWRNTERELNQLPQFKVQVDGAGLHFIHVRGQGPKPLPLLLSHGYPDSFLRMTKLVPLLTNPAAHGGNAEDAFDVIVPSLPGFGFSDRPRQRGCDVPRIATLFDRLMTETLGYTTYAAHGGDWGGAITEQLAYAHTPHVLGIHMTEVPFNRLFGTQPSDLTPAEKAYLEAGRKWQRREGGYHALLSTKPQTIAAGLNDSPAGLAAWIVEKYRSWSDCVGNVETRFSKDELLANITLYWVTQTIHSASRIYYEANHNPRPDPARRITTPTAITIFPKDITIAPREYAERFFNLQHWVELAHGGHFAALEEPEVLAGELRVFFRKLR
jgi:pimeloyl-ACP methyl ester carboxylesterase